MFDCLDQGDTDTMDTENGDVFGEWSKIVQNRKHQNISSSGSDNLAEYRALSLDDKLTVIYTEITGNKTKMSWTPASQWVTHSGVLKTSSTVQSPVFCS